jgi:hypothetical protein
VWAGGYRFFAKNEATSHVAEFEQLARGGKYSLALMNEQQKGIQQWSRIHALIFLFSFITLTREFGFCVRNVQLKIKWSNRTSGEVSQNASSAMNASENIFIGTMAT